MSLILRMATVIVTLALAATSIAQARPINYWHHRLHPGYAGPVHSSTPSVGSWGGVPGRGIVGESCDLPTSACPNDERISN
jgi:hypothetical protein